MISWNVFFFTTVNNLRNNILESCLWNVTHIRFHYDCTVCALSFVITKQISNTANNWTYCLWDKQYFNFHQRVCMDALKYLPSVYLCKYNPSILSMWSVGHLKAFSPRSFSWTRTPPNANWHILQQCIVKCRWMLWLDAPTPRTILFCLHSLSNRNVKSPFCLSII